jgi:hypothetical protein
VADDGATWAPASSEAAAVVPRTTCHLPPRCWVMAKVLGPLVLATAAGTPGWIRSGTTVATATKGQAAADRTVQI